VTLTFTP